MATLGNGQTLFVWQQAERIRAVINKSAKPPSLKELGNYRSSYVIALLTEVS